MKAINIHNPLSTKEQIKANMAAREAAEEFVRELGEQCPRFWEELAKIAAAKGPEAKAAESLAMTEKEAFAFEKEEVPRGKFEGYEVGEVKTGYLLWWSEEDEFTKKLHRYVASPTFKKRQEEEANGQT